MSALDRSAALHYPTSDGRALDGDLNRILMMDLIQTLIKFFKGQNVYVSGNLLVFFEKGNNKRHVSPDVFVVNGAEMRMRDNYLVWKEGIPPSVVIEITSKMTRAEDTQKKFKIYRDEIGVAEFFLFDPAGDYLEPRLQGYKLVGADYIPLKAVNGRLFSRELGLWLYHQGEQLRLFDPQANVELESYSEQMNLVKTNFSNQ